MTQRRTFNRPSSEPLRAVALLLLGLLAACGENSAGGAGARLYGRAGKDSAAGIGDCDEPRAGCACAGNQPPLPCKPEQSAEPGYCFEGTRYCRAGRFGACEDVQRFAIPENASSTSLVDDGALEHGQCEDCERTCFSVVDNFSPEDGELAEAFADGVRYHSRGAGITLSPNEEIVSGPVPPPDSLPPDTIYLQIYEGLSRSGAATTSVQMPASDVYLLLDQSLGMDLETQSLFDSLNSGALLPPGAACSSSDPADAEAGLLGALRCLSASPELGLGMFRDLPFAPYAEDQSLAASERDADARAELVYRNRGAMAADLSQVPAMFASLGGLQSSGDPDVAGSQLPALYAVATGSGFFTGIGRAGLPQAPPCSDDRFGYPCFRADSRPIVVLVTGAPFHNGPSLAAYDYDPDALGMLGGTSPGVTFVAGTSDDWPNAVALPGDAGATLAVYEGSTQALTPAVPASALGCGVDANAAEALFRFEVSGSASAGVSLSTEGSAFPAVLALTTGPIANLEARPDADGSNESFDTSYPLGDVRARRVEVHGDTGAPAFTGMASDYQSALLGAACGGSSLSADAAFAFDVNSASAPTELQLSLDMGADHAVLAVFDGTQGVLPRWPANAAPLESATEPPSYPGGVFELPLDAQNGYLSVIGDTSDFAADYSAATVGSACGADDAARDAVFRISLASERTLRFDTEGSSFDTVLSLHEGAPPRVSGDGVPHPAAQTHQNGNETAASAFAIGTINDGHEIYEGDTGTMVADVSDSFGCGMDDTCGDAVYSFDVSARTRVRLEVTATGFAPALALTRAPPSAGATGRYSALALGASHSCGLSGGRVYCWGKDDVGQLGNGGGAGDLESFAPVEVAGLSSVVQIGAGGDHTCAVTQSGAVYCWGEGSGGELGAGITGDRYAPVQVLGVGGSGTLSGAVQVACGREHCCALRGNDGRALCWGQNGHGQLGNYSLVSTTTPVIASGSTRSYEQIAANDDQSCAIRTTDHSVYCWGEGSSGEMGDGSPFDNLTPRQVLGSAGSSHVVVGEDHACAVLESGRVLCWGAGADGRLGQGTGDLADHATPVLVLNSAGDGELADITGSFAAGAAYTCATTRAGFVTCWGDNQFRQLGDDSDIDRPLPVGVYDLLDAVQVVASSQHSCALRKDGAIACWGNGGSQLGSGDAATPSRPVAAQAGSPSVSFGTGMLDQAFTKACAAPAQPPEPGCWRTYYGGKSYFMCGDRLRTWAGAALACDAVGYALADIDTPGENAYLAARLPEPAWIGVKRASSPDFVDLLPSFDYVDLAGDPFWHTEQIGHDECNPWPCSWVPTRGWFHPAAASDLVDSDPWSTASTWMDSGEPHPDAGRNCAELEPSGHWKAGLCSAIPSGASCGSYGQDCQEPVLGDLADGPLAWVTPWISDLGRLADESLAGRFGAPHFAGGAELGYVCEERGPQALEVTLDPGRYYVMIKGSNDDNPATACGGAYALHIDDLQSQNGASQWLACSDDDATAGGASALERTLPAGEYYVVVKGKQASDAGPFALTVRDVDAVPGGAIACDASAGAADPAALSFMATPGHQYYALVKGEAPLDRGPYTLALSDPAADEGEVVACDGGSGPGGSAQLEVALEPGEYYAVLKGAEAGAAGDYRLTIGGADPVATTFTPPTYGETLAALDAHDVRVASVISCEAGVQSCDDAAAQAEQLADDTAGTAALVADPADVPAQIVSAVSMLEAADSVSAALLFLPDGNPGFSSPTVTAVAAPGNLCGAASGASFSDCQAGATPSFAVSLTNPALAPVPLAPDDGVYEFTLRITALRGGDVVQQRDVSVLASPSGSVPAGTFSSGSYFQDFEELGCTQLNGKPVSRPNLPDGGSAERQPLHGQKRSPSWDHLSFDVDVRPDTSITFSVCTATSRDQLSKCATGVPSSGYRRAVTITAGSGAGTPCTAATQLEDCPGGYCSPYTRVCNYVEGGPCEEDSDCPGAADNSCRQGPSFDTLGRTCSLPDLIADPASVLDSGNFMPALRVKMDLASQGDRSRTPSVFFWEVRYNCRSVL